MCLLFLQEDAILSTRTMKGTKCKSELLGLITVGKDSEIPGDTKAQVVILNDSNKYEQMSADESFDERIWFYFQDEAEFQRAFDTSNDEFEFVITREEN